MSATPYANGGRLLRAAGRPADGAVRPPRWERRASTRHENTKPLGELLRDIYAGTTRESDGGGDFRLFCPDETASNRLGAVFEVTDRCLQVEVLDHRRPPLPGRPGDGGAVRAPVPGLAGGLPADRAARVVRHLRGVRDGLGLDAGPAHQVAAARPDAAVAGRGRLAQRAADLDLLAQRPQRLLPPGSGTDRHRDPARPRRGAGLAATGRQLHAVDRPALPAEPRPREPDRRRQAATPAVPDSMDEAEAHCCRGRRCGTGPAPRTRAATSPTSSSLPPATYPPWRCLPLRPCCASTCPTCGCGSSTWST